MANIIVTDRIKGKIKPMHGVGAPPNSGLSFGLFHYLTEAGIPFSRLHDASLVASVGSHLVDVPLIFPDFDADPADPASYDFAFTDELMKALHKAGVEPFYRLGVSIENYCEIKRYHIDPPRDPLKWAKICEGIIRHYNEGWADGFHFGLRYFEIWNEPDNHEDASTNQMWTGTKEDYYALYGTASRYLKERFPELKIGGYASCGFYGLVCDPASSPSDFRYYIDFFEGFLAYVRDNRCPLDFFSWHTYMGVPQMEVMAKYVRDKLDEYGFTETEHTLNEWNICHDKRGTSLHSANTAAMILAMQDTSLSSAMFYDARLAVSYYAGLFDPMTRTPTPTYDCFVFFNELCKRKDQLLLSLDDGALRAVAAKGENDVCLMAANMSADPVPLSLDLGGRRIVSAKIIKDDKRAEAYDFTGTLPGLAVLLLIAQ
ncbi:MAG: hypothetical protein MJ070_01900 [Lachnospiraceae bacterium]|nr:hypothetical protein [Lachnospiraceae bacterium]